MTEFGYKKDNLQQMPYQHYLEQYQSADPKEISERLRIPYDQDKKQFRLKFIDTVYGVTWPDYQITHEDNSHGYYPLEEQMYAKTLVLRYLLQSRPVLPSGEFKTYRELPWGEVYYRQFDGRCIKRLAFGFGNKIERFGRILKTLGAEQLSMGDVSYELEIFEYFHVRFILWEGDDEFPPSAQILFSENFGTAFDSEDLVVTGEVSISTFKALDKALS